MEYFTSFEAAAKDVARTTVAIGSVGGVGAVPLMVSLKKVEATQYKINSIKVDPNDPNRVTVNYEPAVELAGTDNITFTGTPIDGVYKPLEASTRNDIIIKPSTPITKQYDNVGSFRVKTDLLAREKGGVLALKAGSTKIVSKTGDAVTGLYKYLKYGLIALAVIIVIGLLIKGASLLKG